MTNLDSILKSRDITLPIKVHIVKAMVFPVVLYGCESWTMKAEHSRTDAFELWCWTRLLRAPWTARRSNQSILKEFHPEYSLESLMLKLKLKYFGHLIWRTSSFEKSHMLGKIERGRRSGQQRIRWLDGMTNSFWTCIWANSGRQWKTGKPSVLQSIGSQESDMTEQLKNDNSYMPIPPLHSGSTWHIWSHSWRGFCFRMNRPWVSPVSDLDNI